MTQVCTHSPALPRLDPEFFELAGGLKMATYHRPGQGLPILCIPGLTRNHRDFLPLLQQFPDRPFYLMDLRGRGASDWDPDPSHYQPPMYAQDLAAWIDHLDVPAFDWVGTSLGGILTMALSATHVTRMHRVVINDIGPVIERAGIDAIRQRVGRQGPWPDYSSAREAIIAGQSPEHPREADWDERTQALCRQTDRGWRVDYDPAISQQAQGGDIPTFWELYDGLAEVPGLIVRGECSDLFSVSTLEQMLQQPHKRAVTVARTGHAPTLKESEAKAALAEFLA